MSVTNSSNNGGYSHLYKASNSQSSQRKTKLSQPQEYSLKNQQQYSGNLVDPFSAETRVMKKNLVYVIGISSSIADEELLRQKEYFGQYGNIHVLTLKGSTNRSQKDSEGNSLYSAFITYSLELEASLAVIACSDTIVEGRQIRSSYGTTKFCPRYKQLNKCVNIPDCPYYHPIKQEQDLYQRLDATQDNNTFIDQKPTALKNIKKFSAELLKMKETMPLDFTPVLPSVQKVIQELIDNNHLIIPVPAIKKQVVLSTQSQINQKKNLISTPLIDQWDTEFITNNNRSPADENVYYPTNSRSKNKNEDVLSKSSSNSNDYSAKSSPKNSDEKQYEQSTFLQPNKESQQQNRNEGLNSKSIEVIQQQLTQEFNQLDISIHENKIDNIIPIDFSKQKQQQQQQKNNINGNSNKEIIDSNGNTTNSSIVSQNNDNTLYEKYQVLSQQQQQQKQQQQQQQQQQQPQQQQYQKQQQQLKQQQVQSQQKWQQQMNEIQQLQNAQLGDESTVMKPKYPLQKVNKAEKSKSCDLNQLIIKKLLSLNNNRPRMQCFKFGQTQDAEEQQQSNVSNNNTIGNDNNNKQKQSEDNKREQQIVDLLMDGHYLSLISPFYEVSTFIL